MKNHALGTLADKARLDRATRLVYSRTSMFHEISPVCPRCSGGVAVTEAQQLVFNAKLTKFQRMHFKCWVITHPGANVRSSSFGMGGS
jgi:hypothetical protein